MYDIPSACIYSSVAAIGGVVACVALTSKSSPGVLTTPSGPLGCAWGLVTGIGSGALMLSLKGRQHVIPCHWPCYAGFVPPSALAWWAVTQRDSGKEKDNSVSSKASFLAGFVTATLSGLSLVFFMSPKDILKK